MRHIPKSNVGSSQTLAQVVLEAWLSENASNIESAIKSGRAKALWDEAFQLYSFPKPKIKAALLEEQFFVCCYCNKAIAANPKSTIEHFLPKSIYHNHVFNYENLFAACDGAKGDEDFRPSVHCDAEGAKGGKDPTKVGILSPSTIEIEKQFDFTENGKMAGKTALAVSTINELNLNHEKLVINRRRAIEEFDMEDDPLEPYQDMADGKYKLSSFCSAISFIKKKLES